MTLDNTNFQPALKQLYPDFAIEELVYKNNPWYALCPKFEGFEGDVLKMPIIRGHSQNVSTTFANALSGVSNGAVEAFLLTRKSNYSLASLSNEVLESSRSNSGAFISAAKFVMDGALASLGRQLAIQMFGSGTGKIGQISAVAALNTSVTLARPQDIVNFEVGMSLQAAVLDGGGAAKTAAIVSAIDRVNGKLTMAVDVSGVPGWAAADYLYVAGNYDNTIKGMDAWIPYDNRTARLAASYFGVTRSTDENRLGGAILDISGQPIEEGILDAANFGANIGDGEYDYCILNPIDFSNLIKALGSKVQYCQATTSLPSNNSAQVGFNAVAMYYSGGMFKVIGDRNCPKGRGFLVTSNTWKFASLGKAVKLFDNDGNMMLRSNSADGLDIRTYSYSQLGCTAPGKNLQFNLG